MTTLSRDRILSDLAELLADFQGREYSEPIDAETLFFGDLGFVSIDAVVLGETLEEKYGHKFPFYELISGLAQSGVQDLEVGVVAAFVEQQLSDVARKD